MILTPAETYFLILFSDDELKDIIIQTAIYKNSDGDRHFFYKAVAMQDPDDYELTFVDGSVDTLDGIVVTRDTLVEHIDKW